jgi:branched-chain amino acid aminotransferase
MSDFLPKAYVKGAIVPFEEAQISIATHALHYGTAAFAGMRVYPNAKDEQNPLLFRPDLHIQRLARSAKLLGFPISEQDIATGIKAFVTSNPTGEPYYMRPLIYASDLGVAPRLHNLESDLLIYGVAMGKYLSTDGISCCFSSWVRGEDRSLPLRGKISGTYVTSALAKTEAINRGFDEAIFFNSRGKLAEGSAMNLFLVKDGVLITPSVTQDILEGITRRSVLELARELSIPVEEREVDRSELLIADEAFLTGTAAQIAPISKVEQYEVSASNPVTQKIQQALASILDGTDDRGWLTTL